MLELTTARGYDLSSRPQLEGLSTVRAILSTLQIMCSQIITFLL